MHLNRVACCIDQVAPLPSGVESDLSINSRRDDRPICKICLETELDSHKMIFPCKCKGTLKFVHEECLKTWLVSLNTDINEPSCELCKTAYIMHYDIGYKCSCKDGLTEGLINTLFMILLLVVITMLTLILYLLFEKHFEGAKNTRDESYIIGLILICIFSILVLLALIINVFRTSFCARQLKSWNFVNQQLDENEESEDLSELSVLDRLEVPLVMTLPKNIVLKGVKVETPVLIPSLNPIMRNGRLVAFTPMLGQSLVSRGSSANANYTTPLHAGISRL